MIVGFPLPEWLSRPAQQTIRLARGAPLQRLQQPAGRHLRQQQHMNMVRHHHERSKLIMPEFRPTMQGLYHQVRDGVLAKEHGASTSHVQLAVQPDESLTGRRLVGWREAIRTDSAVKAPGEEQPATLGIKVRQAANGDHTEHQWDGVAKNLASTRVSTRHARVRAPQLGRRCDRQLDDGQPEILNGTYHFEEVDHGDGLGDVAVGVEVIGVEDVLFGAAGGEDHHGDAP